MARLLSELQATLKGLEGVEDAYITPPTSGMKYPCIMIEPDTSTASFADNVKYRFKRRYTITVMDRNPDSLIPFQVESLPYSKFERFFRLNGLNHSVFQLFF